MKKRILAARPVSRRDFVASASLVGLSGALLARAPVIRAAEVTSRSSSSDETDLVTNFPQKGGMILQRTRPPLLETPFEIFDRGAFTPNDRFYVRWHLPNIPTTIDPANFRLNVHGQVRQPLSVTLEELVRDFAPFEIAAVNQCSGNSRSYFEPRVTGAQWANGAMGNALWRGVRLKDVLDRAGISGGAVQVRFSGLDTGLLPQTPTLMKSLAVDHARDGEVMIAYQMNGEPLPLLNGYPIRLIVPGWYATYWIKMLTDIEVLGTADENYWMSKAYLIPDTPGANMAPNQKDVKLVPIGRMVPRSFITSLHDGADVKRDELRELRGIAFGGDSGISKVLLSVDAGGRWQEAHLGQDHGKYSFRQWKLPIRFDSAGTRKLMVKAINSSGLAQPDHPNWNGGGYMRNVVESISVQVS